MKLFLIIFLSILLLALITTFILVIISYFKSPFVFPYKNIEFDVSGVRLPDIKIYIDNYLIEHGFTPIENHFKLFNEWKNKCELIIKNSIFKKRRQIQFEKILDEEKLFMFIFFRKITKYRQRNYVRYSYKSNTPFKKYYISYKQLLLRYKKLQEINFKAPLSIYESKQQRKLMTKELKEYIKIRDNFTCKICGKHMPDEVGLHIDHIIPISKGGKSTFDNLQVLCSKCNGKKSSKIVK